MSILLDGQVFHLYGYRQAIEQEDYRKQNSFKRSENRRSSIDSIFKASRDEAINGNNNDDNLFMMKSSASNSQYFRMRSSKSHQDLGFSGMTRSSDNLFRSSTNLFNYYKEDENPGSSDEETDLDYAQDEIDGQDQTFSPSNQDLNLGIEARFLGTKSNSIRNLHLAPRPKASFQKKIDIEGWFDDYFLPYLKSFLAVCFKYPLLTWRQRMQSGWKDPSLISMKPFSGIISSLFSDASHYAFKTFFAQQFHSSPENDSPFWVFVVNRVAFAFNYPFLYNANLLRIHPLMGKWRRYSVNRYSPIVRSFFPCFLFNIFEERIYTNAALRWQEPKNPDNETFLRRNKRSIRLFLIKSIIYPLETVILSYILGLEQMSYSSLRYESLLSVFKKRAVSASMFTGFKYLCFELVTDLIISEIIILLGKRIHKFFRELEE